MAKTKVILLRRTVDLIAGQNSVVIDPPEGFMVVSGGYALALNGNTAEVLTAGTFHNHNPPTASRYVFECFVTIPEGGASCSAGVVAVAAEGSLIGVIDVDVA